jgi:hypothetical protein
MRDAATFKDGKSFVLQPPVSYTVIDGAMILQTAMLK